MTATDGRTDQLESDAWYKPYLILTTRKVDHKISITISDNGQGISSQNLAKIFQPFFTTKPTGEGTGLGLSMAYDIITKGHGGELKVKSRGGEGTDFEMPLMQGFDLLEQMKNLPVAVIFTTAFHHYAIRAIRYSALDYLLKPIDPKELRESIARYEMQKSRPGPEQFQFLIDKLTQKEHTHKKLAIPNMEGFKLISVDDIIACEADDNYTHILLKNKTRITASRTLKDIQQLLSEYENFIRVHHASLINLNEVNQYIRGEGGYLIMSDGSHINVSRNKKEALLRYLVY